MFGDTKILQVKTEDYVRTLSQIYYKTCREVKTLAVLCFQTWGQGRPETLKPSVHENSVDTRLWEHQKGKGPVHGRGVAFDLVSAEEPPLSENAQTSTNVCVALITVQKGTTNYG